MILIFIHALIPLSIIVSFKYYFRIYSHTYGEFWSHAIKKKIKCNFESSCIGRREAEEEERKVKTEDV
jgi:hypothetical protein